MAEYTRPATWEDVKRLARHIEEAGADYALSHANSRRWIFALSRLPDGAAKELEPDSDVFAGQQRYAIRVNDEFTVDVLPSAAGATWEELCPFIRALEIDGQRIRVLSLEGLLRTKSGARPKDQADAAAIRRALELLGRR